MKKNKLINHLLKYKARYLTLFAVLALLASYFFIYKIYIPRINAFGCFDDCFNYMGGYFMLHNKHMYSDFFFNHQPLAAYLSMIIQYFTHPSSIFELLLRHRQFLILFGLFFNLFFILRFGAKMFLFTIIFEFSKFYLFGDRFLAESYIVYPIVYLAIITIYKFSNEKIFNFEYILAAIFTWFIIFSREPYIPLSLFVFFLIMIGNITFYKKLSLAIFILLSLVTIFSFNISDFYFNVVLVNFHSVLFQEIKGQNFGGPIEALFYPIFIFIDGPMNIFRTFLIGIDIMFIISFIKIIKDKKYLLSLIIFIVLFLSNLRPTLPGKPFYESYHLVNFYALFVLFAIFMLLQIQKNIQLKILGLSILTVSIILFVSSPLYFANEKINQQDELITNYGSQIQEGNVIKILSKKSDNIFMDGSEDLVYFQSQRSSEYKYTWYTGIMHSIGKYNNARLEMFKNDPPDFYRSLGICMHKSSLDSQDIPIFAKDSYIELLNDNKPSCLFIRKGKLSSVTQTQWKEAEKNLYTLPK